MTLRIFSLSLLCLIGLGACDMNKQTGLCSMMGLCPPEEQEADMGQCEWYGHCTDEDEDGEPDEAGGTAQRTRVGSGDSAGHHGTGGGGMIDQGSQGTSDQGAGSGSDAGGGSE